MHITYPSKSGRQNLSEPMDNSFHQLSMSHWLFDLKLLPTTYHQIIGAVTSSLGLDSSLIYKVFLSSGLNQPILQHIWSTTSQSHPGWFTPAELVSALALIGLAQAEQVNRSHTSLETLLHSLSLKRLHTLPCPPIPQVQLPVERPMVELRTTNQTNIGSISCIPFDYPAMTSDAIKKQPQATWPFSALPDYKRNSFSIETKSTAILSDPSEDEWADFTSCKPPVNEDICRPADPLNTIKCDFEWPAREHTKPPRLPDNRDDDFGEFQTISKQVESDQNSTKTAQVPDLTRTSVPLPLRPNYNVSMDPSSEMTPLESVQHEWLRCVVQCAELMRDSLDALQLINTDAEKTEFNETEEGVEFFSDILEVYQVANRIKGSAERLALLHTPLQIRLAEIKTAMSKLFQYIVKDDIKVIWTSVLSKPAQDANSLDALAGFINPNSTEPLCGVCLSSFSTDSQAPQSGTVDSSLAVGSVALAGRIYHTPCANLWINRVQLSLPALVPP